jgi:hypothetical protein
MAGLAGAVDLAGLAGAVDLAGLAGAVDLAGGIACTFTRKPFLATHAWRDGYSSRFEFVVACSSRLQVVD